MSVGIFAAAQLMKVLPRTRISRVVGNLCERKLPRAVSRLVEGTYCRAFQVDMSEVAEREGPYPSFDGFFTRTLRAGARPISEDRLVSPADGLLSATGPIDAGARLFVKGNHYEVGELVGEQREASRYAGGCYAVIYLSPSDYHRVHAPVDGRLMQVRCMPGDCLPVNAIGERYFPRLFVRNHRIALVIETEMMGRVTVVMVGAVIVGRITVTALPNPVVPPGVHEVEPAVTIERGDEIGIFHLGSTVVVLLEPPTTISYPEGPVRYGQSLLKAP